MVGSRMGRWLVWLVIVTGSARVAGQVSPFTSVEFEDDGRVMVTLPADRAEQAEGAGPVELVSIGGVGAAELMAGAKEAFGNRWQKRIGEDLLDVFEAMGVELPRKDAIDLAVRQGEAVRRIEEAPMTAANRAMVRRHNRAIDAEREAAAVGAMGAASLDALAGIIRERHAYATLRGVDLDAVVAAEKARLGESPARDDVLLAAQRVVCTLGDGHAGVAGWDDTMPAGRLPFMLVGAAGGVAGGVVAIENDRTALVDRAHPYVVSIDGVALDRWIEAASAYVPAGSEQLVRERSLRLIRYVNLVRTEMGLDRAGTTELVLSDGRGGERSVVREVGDRRGIYGQWPRTSTGVLEGGVGYLRLSRMTPPESEWTDARWSSWLREELATATDGATNGAMGLIIDVRGNGGGRRVPVRALMPCLMGPGDAPIVVNAARARIDPSEDPADPDGFLANRFLYPEAWNGWTDAERESIAAFRRSFEPAWAAPEQGFSGWHYMAVSPGGDDVPRFGGPVVVLMDENCFSATDIFLAAMGELPRVTLVGTASAGGSARSRRHETGGLEIRLASMVSYQPNGRLFDGVGVRPDAVAEKQPGDAVLGGGDAQLDRAVEIIRRSE